MAGNILKLMKRRERCLGQERQGQSVGALGCPRKDQDKPVVLCDYPADSNLGLLHRWKNPNR
jgi:hypothetical protein